MIDLKVKGTIEFAVAARPFPGEEVSGDLHWACQDGRQAFFAVIDGAGHGQEAATAAACAAAVLNEHFGSPFHTLFQKCHEELQRTRGAAMSLAAIDLSLLTLTWAGVGNVEAALIRQEAGAKNEALLLRSGVVGYNFSQPRVSTLAIGKGDLLLMSTDGIKSYSRRDVDLQASCETIANRLMHDYAKEVDDALILVARFAEDANG